MIVLSHVNFEFTKANKLSKLDNKINYTTKRICLNQTAHREWRMLRF